eukprot:348204-Rhodomonas_salina.5
MIDLLALEAAVAQTALERASDTKPTHHDPCRLPSRTGRAADPQSESTVPAQASRIASAH